MQTNKKHTDEAKDFEQVTNKQLMEIREILGVILDILKDFMEADDPEDEDYEEEFKPQKKKK